MTTDKDKKADEPAKPKKQVDQKTLDMLAKGRAARAEKLAAGKAASPAPAPTTKADVQAEKPAATPKAERCSICWNRPCDKSGKRCPK